VADRPEWIKRARMADQSIEFEPDRSFVRLLTWPAPTSHQLAAHSLADVGTGGYERIKILMRFA
jgi:hypothetical protein